ncbi:hypothetical protein [Neptunitalea lumnitzerae]|uniref:Beta-lactamase-inhibitor-like PepSY-like domain-containing protein n=1 Tax=Neptunitalea lumnitzerae TaxID=2965509 RepID=A0ABQ5MGA9_9FLAO|nr:hypothetical protein [Neptunitalea sp. Y10]GLB48430.1 hypothetical protein Y10_07980 [Neptunitalea sp. Y10]
MKKFFITASMLLGSFATFAMSPEMSPYSNEIISKVQDYKEIKVSELPKAITEAFANDFPGATIDKAYVNEDKKYKLEVTTAEMSTTLYANEKGEWIEK